MSNPLYPIFLKLDNKRVLIVGGGLVALQKLKGFLETAAKITVIAPKIIEEIRDCRGEFPNIRKIDFLERDYAYGDEVGAFIVIAATDNPEINNMIVTRCRDQMILANSVDQPDFCDFYVPSIVESGSIKVAISTNGKAPSVARRLREDLSLLIQNRYLNLVEVVNDFRQKVQEKISNEEDFPRRVKLINWFTERAFRKTERAKLFLIGAGPGDPELLTLKALRVLQEVDSVLYDNLVSEEILAAVFQKESLNGTESESLPELLYVGKKCSEKHITQDEINQLILERLSRGKRVARLKGGDPFIFARGVEELLAAREAGYEVEVIPGLSSGLSVPVSLGIPLTLRKKSDSVMIVSAHELSNEKFQAWFSFLENSGTLVVYMGLYKLEQIRDALYELASSVGKLEILQLPAILVQSGTLPEERIIYSSLEDIPGRAMEEGFISPSLLVLGKHILDTWKSLA